MAEDASGIWILWEILSHPGVTDGIPSGSCPLILRLAQGEEREKREDRRVNPATRAPTRPLELRLEQENPVNATRSSPLFPWGKIGLGRHIS